MKAGEERRLSRVSARGPGGGGGSDCEGAGRGVIALSPDGPLLTHLW